MEGQLGKRPSNTPEDGVEPKRKRSRKQKPGFDEELFTEANYYTKNGLRYIKPYYYTFTSHAKGRWVGSSVYDVFCREFQAEKPEYYEKAIKAGKVKVNGKAASMDTILHHNDHIAHRVHRHEPPVTAQPLTVIHEDSELVVINKPASIPVHPCGRYRHNSVVFLLGRERGIRNLHTIHRLDRLTSGLLLFAKSLSTAQKLEQQIRERKVTKEYICMVHGEFPSEPLECNEPILVVSHKLGVCRVDPSGKPCSTHFKRLSYNGHTSILQCVPRTGRMHQIRVHLQWLGHPIVNDPLYNHPAWGVERGRRGEGIGDMEQVISDIVQSKYSSEVTATPASELSWGGLRSEALHRDRREEEGKSEERPPVLSAQNEVDMVESLIGQSDSRTRTEDAFWREKDEEDKCPRDSVAEVKEEEEEEEGGQGEGRKKEGKEERVEEGGEGEDRGGEGEREGDAMEDKEEAAEPCAVPGADSRPRLGSETERDGESWDPDCTECGLIHPDPTPNELFMCLHALRYKGLDWEFSTELPPWATPESEESRTTCNSGQSKQAD